MSETRRTPSRARTTLNAAWILAIGWLVFAGAGGALNQVTLVVLGYLCFLGAIVTLIVGLVLRSKEKSAV